MSFARTGHLGAALPILQAGPDQWQAAFYMTYHGPQRLQ
ncbi:hypothetical protein X961_5858 [Burkholderia pseudomallei MSHR5613]|nr:hypothetical protein X961_5858 [Burkholderia pseudomallei MSHR5613]